MTKVFGNRICPKCGGLTGTTHGDGCPNPRSEPATAPATFEPDWEALHQRIALAFSKTSRYLEQAVINEYQRQMDEEYVVVRREDVRFAARMLAQREVVTDQNSREVIDRLFVAIGETR